MPGGNAESQSQYQVVPHSIGYNNAIPYQQAASDVTLR